MARMRLPPIGFWSYTRDNEMLSSGRLATLQTRILAEIQARYGRDTVEIFHDTSEVRHGAKWETELRVWIARSTFFIPVLTPHFLQSEWCCREVTLFLERERELAALHPGAPASARIFPIHYVSIDRADTIDEGVRQALHERQWFDFRALQYEDFDGPKVRRAIADYADTICDLLLRQVEAPLSAEETALREQQEERRTIAQREALDLQAQENAKLEQVRRERRAAIAVWVRRNGTPLKWLVGLAVFVEGLNIVTAPRLPTYDSRPASTASAPMLSSTPVPADAEPMKKPSIEPLSTRPNHPGSKAAEHPVAQRTSPEGNRGPSAPIEGQAKKPATASSGESKTVPSTLVSKPKPSSTISTRRIPCAPLPGVTACGK
jgi:hypothetical protein